MKKMTKFAVQGDVAIIRVDDIPEGAVKQSTNSAGVFVVAHSETGHNHVIASGGDDVAFLQDPTDELQSYLDVDVTSILTHLRDFHTHEAIEIPPGKYVVRRQREFTPDGYRIAAD